MLKSVVAAAALVLSAHPHLHTVPSKVTLQPMKSTAVPATLKTSVDGIVRRFQEMDKTIKLEQIYISTKTGEIAFVTITGNHGKVKMALVFTLRDGEWMAIPDLLAAE